MFSSAETPRLGPWPIRADVSLNLLLTQLLTDSIYDINKTRRGKNKQVRVKEQ